MQFPFREHYFGVKAYVDESGKNVWSVAEFEEFPARPEVLRVTTAESTDYVRMSDKEDWARDVQMQFELIQILKEYNNGDSK